MKNQWSSSHLLVASICVAAVSIAASVFWIYSYPYGFSDLQLTLIGGVAVILGYLAAAGITIWLWTKPGLQWSNRKNGALKLFVFAAVVTYAIGLLPSVLPFMNEYVANTIYQVQVLSLAVTTGVLAVYSASLFRPWIVAGIICFVTIWFWHEVVWGFLGSWTPFSTVAWSGSWEWLLPSWSLIVGLCVLVANAIFLTTKHTINSIPTSAQVGGPKQASKNDYQSS